MSDLGPRMLDQYRAAASIDPGWSTPIDGGFGWWPFRQLQRVQASEPWKDQDGNWCVRLTAETDFIVAPAGDDVDTKLISMAFSIALSNISREPDTDVIRLHSSMLITDQNADWAGKMFCHAALVQVSTAFRLARWFSEENNGQPAVSGHPSHGLRDTPDELVGFIDELVRPMGAGPSRWSDDDEFAELTSWFQSFGFPTGEQPRELARWWTVLPFGSGPVQPGAPSIMLRVLDRAPHPILGAGAMVLLMLPMSLDEENGSLATRLNLSEVESGDAPHTLGSWGPVPGGPTGMGLGHVCFLPNFVYERGLLANICFSMVARAQGVASALVSGA